MPPGKVEEEIKIKGVGAEEVMTCRPADLIENELEKLKAEIGSLAKSSEDVLTYALFPEVGKNFLMEKENAGKTKVINIEIF